MKAADTLYGITMLFDGGSVSMWLRDDTDVIAPTSLIGDARLFESENDATKFKDENGLKHMTVTPIKAGEFFKAKLAGL